MKLLFFIISLIIIIYIQYYLKKNQDTKILQVSLQNINYDVLKEKYPIIINDQIVEVGQIFKTFFKYQYLLKARENSLSAPGIKMNLSKYAVFYNQNDETADLYISNPLSAKNIKFKNQKITNFKYLISKTSVLKDNEDINFIKILLKPKTLLILPSWWLYEYSQNIQSFYLFDPLNIFIAIFYKLLHL